MGSTSHVPVLPPKWLLEQLKERYSYNSTTGKVICIKSKGTSRIKAGDEIGNVTEAGYLRAQFGGGKKGYKALLIHHIAWYLHYGVWPSHPIDHRDGNGLSNKIKNLRKCTHQQNIWNKAANINSRTGIVGVYIYGNKYRVTINKKHIGMFNSIEEAKAARISAEKKLHGKFASHLGVNKPKRFSLYLKGSKWDVTCATTQQ